MARLNFRSEREPLATFTLASLTDIVMLLLLLFLPSISFGAQQGLNVNLPDVSSATPLEQQYVAVTVEADGTITVDETPVPRDSLTSVLRAVRGDRPALAVFADENARIAMLAEVAAAAAALDMRVAIATDAVPAGGEAAGNPPAGTATAAE